MPEPMKTAPTVTIDPTPGQIAVVVRQSGETVSYPCTSMLEAEALLPAVERRLGLRNDKGPGWKPRL